MTRPIVWAIGVFASIGVAATFAGEQLGSFTSSYAKKSPETSGAAIRAEPSAPSYSPPPPPRLTPAQAPPPTAPADRFSRSEIIQGDERGHFLADGRVDGARIRLLVDTGATHVVLREEDAARVGIYVSASDFSGRSNTANGVVNFAPITIRSLRIGGIEIRDVEAAVIQRGKLSENLLGMSFLKRLRSFDISGNRITLKG